MHRCIHSVAHLIEDHAAAAGLPLRFAATKLVEGDTLIEKALQLNPNETDILGHAIAEMETVTGWTAKLPLRTCALPLLKSYAPPRW